MAVAADADAGAGAWVLENNVIFSAWTGVNDNKMKGTCPDSLARYRSTEYDQLSPP